MNKNRFLLLSSRLKLYFSVYSRKATVMLLTVIVIIVILLLLLTVKFVVSILLRYSQLSKDYRDISLLPLSPIPCVGNLHLIDKRQYMFYRLIFQLAQECQNQDKGVYCIWLAWSPLVFLCSGKGLEVSTLLEFLSNTMSSFDLDIY